MQELRHFRADKAIVDSTGRSRFVIVGRDDELHRPATAWLGFLHDVGRSPNTIRDYATRLAYYLSWTAQTGDWRAINLAHLAMWRNVLATTPVRKTNGKESFRSDDTVNLWIVPVRGFYEWADAQGLLTTDVVARMTHVKYFAPGTAAGGETGTTKRVLVPELRPTPRTGPHEDPEWIDSADARRKLESLELNLRDRFLVDLLYFTGVRVGEALSLFTRDMHFGGGIPSMGCRRVDPHLHVVMDNPVENGARAKGSERVLPVSEHLVDRYIDYVLERQRLLASGDNSPHVMVNLYARDHHRGKAMTDTNVRKMLRRVSKRIDFDITGPHMLRHTLATRLVRGIDCDPQPLDVVQSILGHRSIESTRIYTHDQERAKKEALAAIAPRTLDLETL